MLTIAILVLLVAAGACLPRWSYSRNWTYIPSIICALAAAAVLVILLQGAVP